jgi:hypothetical protein
MRSGQSSIKRKYCYSLSHQESGSADKLYAHLVRYLIIKHCIIIYEMSYETTLEKTKHSGVEGKEPHSFTGKIILLADNFVCITQ